MILLKGNYATKEVWLNGKKLYPNESQRVFNHSPDGFNWGYGGSGPAQLALAVLLKLCSVTTAVVNYQWFKWEVIAKLPDSDFELNIDTEPYTQSL